MGLMLYTCARGVVRDGINGSGGCTIKNKGIRLDEIILPTNESN